MAAKRIRRDGSQLFFLHRTSSTIISLSIINYQFCPIRNFFKGGKGKSATSFPVGLVTKLLLEWSEVTWIFVVDKSNTPPCWNNQFIVNICILLLCCMFVLLNLLFPITIIIHLWLIPVATNSCSNSGMLHGNLKRTPQH